MSFAIGLLIGLPLGVIGTFVVALCQAAGEASRCLPARFERMQERLARVRGVASTPEHAARVAWRQILRWIEAQLALIDANQTSVYEVFLPHMLSGSPGNERTVAEIMAEKGGIRLLPPAGGTR